MISDGIHLKAGWVEADFFTTAKALRILEKHGMATTATKVFHGLLEPKEPGVGNLLMNAGDFYLQVIDIL